MEAPRQLVGGPGGALCSPWHLAIIPVAWLGIQAEEDAKGLEVSTAAGLGGLQGVAFSPLGTDRPWLAAQQQARLSHQLGRAGLVWTPAGQSGNNQCNS